MDAIPEYMRERIVAAVDECGSVAEVAERFCVSQTSVRNYVQMAAEDNLKPKPRSGGPGTALDDGDRERLLEAVDEQPDATLEELRETCEFEVSISTISRELIRLDRPRKRKVPRASERAEEEVQADRVQWRSDMSDVDAERLICLDETGIATNMTRAYGRAPANVRVYTDVPYRHYDSLTVLGGIRLGGGDEIPTAVYEGGTTAERMVDYINGPLAEILRPGDIVVADQLAAHTANSVAEALSAHDAEIRLLPAYSPDLNPIERLWSKIKTPLRKAKATTISKLKRVLTKALQTITNANIRNWFQHSDYLAAGCEATS